MPRPPLRHPNDREFWAPGEVRRLPSRGSAEENGHSAGLTLSAVEHRPAAVRARRDLFIVMRDGEAERAVLERFVAPIPAEPPAVSAPVPAGQSRAPAHALPGPECPTLAEAEETTSPRWIAKITRPSLVSPSRPVASAHSDREPIAGPHAGEHTSCPRPLGRTCQQTRGGPSRRMEGRRRCRPSNCGQGQWNQGKQD